VCVRGTCEGVCVFAVDELLKPFDTACNMLHLSYLRLHRKDNETAHGRLAVLAMSVCLCCYGAVWCVFSKQVVINIISL